MQYSEMGTVSVTWQAKCREVRLMRYYAAKGNAQAIKDLAAHQKAKRA